MRFGTLHQNTPLILIELVIYIDKTSLLFHTTKTWRIRIGMQLQCKYLAKTWRIRIGIDCNANTLLKHGELELE